MRRRWPLGALALAAVLAALVLTFGVHVNLSGSAPRGIYRVVREDRRRGALVAACLPSAAARWGRALGYVGAGGCPDGTQPVLKTIGARGGDIIELGRDQVIVNGTPLPGSATAAQDSRGRPLPHAHWGRHTVRPDEVWLFATESANSWDSRYFGAVPLRDLRGVAQPVVTVR